jgi:hypothetical protein
MPPLKPTHLHALIVFLYIFTTCVRVSFILCRCVGFSGGRVPTTKFIDNGFRDVVNDASSVPWRRSLLEPQITEPGPNELGSDLGIEFLFYGLHQSQRGVS